MIFLLREKMRSANKEFYMDFNPYFESIHVILSQVAKLLKKDPYEAVKNRDPS